METTRRDLVELKGYSFVPTTWERITGGDNVKGRDGHTWHVRRITQHFNTAQLWLMLGEREFMGEVNRDDPVHVLEPETGWRREEHLGGTPPVRSRKGWS